MKAELDKLKEQGSSGMHTVHIDLSLISKGSGAENATPLEEILSSKRVYKIGHWDEADRLQVAILR